MIKISGDREAIISSYARKNRKALELFKRDSSCIPFERSELCSSVFFDRLFDNHTLRHSNDRVIDGAKVYFICKGCQMTKSLIPYGEFEEFGDPVEYTRIIVWKSKVVEQVTNKCDTKNGILVIMKPSTTEVVSSPEWK